MQGYLYSFALDTPAAAQIAVTAANFVTGFVAIMAIQICYSIPKTRDLAAVLRPIFRIFPQYCVGEAFLNMSQTYATNRILGTSTKILSWDCAGRSVVLLFAEAWFYFALTLMVEMEIFSRAYGWLSRRLTSGVIASCASTPYDMDEDVVSEAARVRAIASDASTAVVRIVDLHKVYLPPWGFHGAYKHAVRGVTLEVHRDEVFGFLGINGAGKSTTLGVLTNDVAASSGACLVAGIASDHPSARRALGYCPQVDPLLEHMTGRETLHLFGRLKGIPSRELPAAVSSTLDHVGLSRFADRPCGTYSGGNKRKVWCVGVCVRVRTCAGG